MRKQTATEELANALTHGVGVALSLAGGALLLVLAGLSGSAWKLVGVSVFVSSLLLLYSASTLYHAARANVLKHRLRVLDHCAIYVLIAGTYTPFTLDAIRGPWGWSLFGLVWILACVGVVFKLFCAARFSGLSTAIYLAMGWMVLIAARPLAMSLSTAALFWLVAGGLAYTTGTLFYHARRLPFAHAVWHMFVIAGSLCHGIAVGVQI